jgi:hypothetical protein
MKSTVVELILTGCVGMWLGAMMMYLMIIRPLHQENEDLKEVIHLGNTVKYVSRAGKKGTDKELQDLNKALWYLKRKIEILEKNGK